VTLGLRDWSQRTITLTARAAADPAVGRPISRSGRRTTHGANLSGALQRAIQAEAQTALAARPSA
jgi:hypothetical protein